MFSAGKKQCPPLGLVCVQQLLNWNHQQRFWVWPAADDETKQATWTVWSRYKQHKPQLTGMTQVLACFCSSSARTARAANAAQLWRHRQVRRWLQMWATATWCWAGITRECRQGHIVRSLIAATKAVRMWMEALCAQLRCCLPATHTSCSCSLSSLSQGS